ncbi:MAG TPA: nickel-dependent lactate racemase [Pyrinomonadaceae bacterium]|nr:nickel-dependent lactate racemase [Pyrinomonadaceae bacterium]
MPTIELGYGRSAITFDYDTARFDVLAPGEAASHPLSDVEIGAALDDPIDSLPLEELVTAGESALIVVSDATRATGSAQIVNLLVRRLIENGVSPGDIAIIFATGIHRAVRADEKAELLTPFIAQRIRTIDHDAYDPSQLIQLGSTERGTPVQVNRALKEFDKVILTGAVRFHYFAGFAGGRKSICPGLAAAQTIKATHMLALDFEGGGRRAGVGAGLLEGNAVSEECEHIASMIDPVFSINAIVDERGRCEKVFAGHWRTGHARACEDYAAGHSVRISEKLEIVVVSCGGSPFDINLIQAHKALDMAAAACVDGGTIVLLAECGDGLGRPDFLKWFESDDSRALELRLREAYEVNGQTAWALFTKAERFKVHIVTKLPDDDVRRMRMNPARSLEDALMDLSSDTKGYIMPRGAASLPVLGSP